MSGIDTDVLENMSDNLKLNSSKLSKHLEMRMGIIDSFVDNAGFDKTADVAEGVELLRLTKPSMAAYAGISVPADMSDFYKACAEVYSTATGFADRVILCKMMARSLGDGRAEVASYKLLEPERDTAHDFDFSIRISYRKAHGADVAFEKFASVIPDTSAVYRDSFNHVCDAVAVGDADMCILPYENTADGKLSGFYRLIESYELKIAASCMVKSDNRDDETRYLLLSPTLSGLSEISGITDFEFSLVDRDGTALTGLMAAANLLGVNIKSVDTFKTDDYTVFDVRTSGDCERLDALILYLKLEAAEFSPLGLYAATE